AAARGLLGQAREAAAGRAARTLTPGDGAVLKQTMMALTEGEQLAEHRAPGPATIQVLQGEVVLRTGGTNLELAQGHWAAIPIASHDLLATSDAVVLLTVAMPSRDDG